MSAQLYCLRFVCKEAGDPLTQGGANLSQVLQLGGEHVGFPIVPGRG